MRSSFETAAYLKRLGGRLLTTLMWLGFLPMMVVLFLLAFPWWLLTGNTIPVPRWMERMHDGHGY